MSITNTCHLHQAEAAARRIVELLAPSCERITIAGSIRRQQPLVNDIEIVATPKLETAAAPGPGELFAKKPVDLLAKTCDAIARGELEGIGKPNKCEGLRMPAWGPRYKALAAEYEKGRWIALDLFIVAKGSWGPLLAIRTGPADFSKMLVTSVDSCGAMPRGMKMDGGVLKHRVYRNKPADDHDAWEDLFITEEPEFFDTLKVPFIEPPKRSLVSLRRALGGLA